MRRLWLPLLVSSGVVAFAPIERLPSAVTWVVSAAFATSAAGIILAELGFWMIPLLNWWNRDVDRF